jgi:hypothetical protein
VRDAIVFVPGIGRGTTEARATASSLVRHVARLIMGELAERAGGTGSSSFRLAEKSDHELEGCTAFTIYRKNDRREFPVLDVYGVDYRDALTHDLMVRNPILRAVWLMISAFSMLLRYPLILRPRRNSKPLRELTQACYATVILLLVAVYTFTIVLAAVALIWYQLTGHRPPISTAQSIVVIGSLLGLFTPAYRELLTASATDWAASAVYMLPSPVRARTGRRLRETISFVADRAEVNRVHLVAYSFGSVIALDSVFPRRADGISGVTVDHLFTIGCSYDFLRLFVPHYFEDRVGGDVSKWINIYVPSDILGSNFRQDNQIGPAELGINTRVPNNVVFNPEERYAAFSFLRLNAFRAHEAYWGEEGQPNCFTAIAEIL